MPPLAGPNKSGKTKGGFFYEIPDDKGIIFHSNQGCQYQHKVM